MARAQCFDQHGGYVYVVVCLHRFSDGANPAAGLVLGNNSNFFGTTFGGGEGLGAVFKITSAGTLTALYNFTGGADGGSPQAGLVWEATVISTGQLPPGGRAA